MKRVITDDQFAAVAAESEAWRWTQLCDALVERFDCCPSTARRMINRAVSLGLVMTRDGSYHATPDTGTTVAKRQYRRVDRRALLTVLLERPSWRWEEMMGELRSRLGAAETTVRTSVKYARDFGYLERRDAGWSVTARCHDQLACYGRLEGAEGFRFAAFLSGHPKRAFHRWRHQPP